MFKQNKKLHTKIIMVQLGDMLRNLPLSELNQNIRN